jgi:dockerin type I repeat protein
MFRKLTFLMLLSAVIAITGISQQKHLPPDYEKKMEAIRNFEYGVEPLFVMGDLNEDGVVDQKDLGLSRAYVERRTSAGISCLAAGDLNTDGVVDAKDVALFEKALQRGPVEAAPLAYHSSLPCDYRNFFIAAGPGARPGGVVPIHFLDARFTTQNSTVEMQNGAATVSKMPGEYLVQVAKTAVPESLVTVNITLADRKKYTYTFSVRGPARSR